MVDQRDLMPEILLHRADSPSRLVVAAFTGSSGAATASPMRASCQRVLARPDRRRRGRPSRVTIVRNGPAPRRTAAAATDPSLKMGGELPGLWVGKMGVQDRVDLVVDVVEQVVRAYGETDLRFALVGNGECLEELRADVNDSRSGSVGGVSGLALRVGSLCLFGGHSDLWTRHLAAGRGVTRRRRWSTWPSACRSYVSTCRKRERICEGAAVLVPPPDMDSVAKAVVTLMDDPGQRSRLGGAGRRTVARFARVGASEQELPPGDLDPRS